MDFVAMDSRGSGRRCLTIDSSLADIAAFLLRKCKPEIKMGFHVARYGYFELI
jgi:hypothetical protein